MEKKAAFWCHAYNLRLKNKKNEWLLTTFYLLTPLRYIYFCQEHAHFLNLWVENRQRQRQKWKYQWITTVLSLPVLITKQQQRRQQQRQQEKKEKQIAWLKWNSFCLLYVLIIINAKSFIKLCAFFFS